MIISATEGETFGRCKRMHYLGSFNGIAIEPIMPPLALQLGKLIHRAHEMWCIDWYDLPDRGCVICNRPNNGTPQHDPLNDTLADAHLYQKPERVLPLWQHFIMAAVKAEEQIKTRYKARVGCNPNDEEMEPFQKLVMDLGRAMCVNYQEHWTEPIDPAFKLIRPEQTLLLPIPNTRHTREFSHLTMQWHECNDQETLTEYIDVLSGKPAQHKHKCDGQHYLECTLDALIQHIESERLFILERKTYSNRPRLDTLSVNAQFHKYTWALTQLNVGQVGGIAYDGMWKRAEYNLKKYTVDDYFIRTPIVVTSNEIVEIEEQLTAEANEMASDYTITKHRRWEGCFDDKAFDGLCRAISRGDDSAYILSSGFARREKGGREDVWTDD